MRMRVASQPLLRGLFLVDERGNWLANSVLGASRNLNYADRDYFRHHRDIDDEKVLVGLPVRSKVDGTWVITLTRRINHPDGSFAGILTATIATEVFQSIFRSFDIGTRGVVTMMNGRNRIVVRQPYAEENVGRDVTNSQVVRELGNAVEARSFEYVGLIDGLTRIGSLRRVPGFDLIVVVSRAKDEVLAEWWRETQVHLTWMSFALLALATLLWRKVLSLRAHARTSALYRLVADNSSDAIVLLGRHGHRRYVSPAFWAMTGWTEADLLQKPFTEIVFPEDRPISDRAFADLMAGSQVTAEFRYLCRDGTTVWVELRARPTADPLGGLPVFVGNIRNISRQKAAEEQLAAISLTDPLTAIANRRHFDEALLKEWSRAARDGTPLALLMVDADHFKTYNDTYGHPQGDACLRAIAQVLANSIRRPGAQSGHNSGHNSEHNLGRNMAARYGGEEFAVIMPGTSAEAAAVMAERIRRSLACQAMEHLGHEAGVVTVSIGVAALVPQRGADPEVLIRSADQALYEAKRTGRNRVVRHDAAPVRVRVVG
jgi:PAS domain S-box-containing protein